MIDAQILPIQHRILAPIAKLFLKRGVSADQVTLAGFGIGVLAAIVIAFGFYKLGLILILLNRIADGLDGVLARQSSSTDRGAYLDIALDFAFYALIPLAFALSHPSQNALAATILITSFIGTGSSFLAYAVIAAKRGEEHLSFPSKGIYYLGGLTEGFETILCFILMCLFPTYFPAFALVFAGLCFITTIMRWRLAWHSFN